MSSLNLTGDQLDMKLWGALGLDMPAPKPFWIPEVAWRCDGPGHGASIAARYRSRDEYRTAAIIEFFYGEVRTWTGGKTQHFVFAPIKDEFSKRCDDRGLNEAYASEIVPVFQ